MKQLLIIIIFLQLLQAQDYPKIFTQLGTLLYKADRTFIKLSKLDSNIKKMTKHYHLKTLKLRLLAQKIQDNPKDSKLDRKRYINELRQLQKDYDSITRHVNVYLFKSIDNNNYKGFSHIMTIGHDIFLDNNIIKKRAMAYYVEHRTRGAIPVLEESYFSLKSDPLLYSSVKGYMPRTHFITQRYSEGGLAHKILLSKDEKTAFISYGEYCFKSVSINPFEDASSLAIFNFHAQSCKMVDMQMSTSGKYIFLSDLENGFTVLDISQPRAPLQKDEWTRIHPLSSVTSKDDTTSFVLSKDRGLIVLDIYNKDEFRLLANYNKGLHINHLALDDKTSKLYLAHTKGISVLDVSVLGNPRELYFYPIANGANNIVLDTQNKLAYLASGEDGIHVFDISKDDKVSLISTCLTPSYAHNLTLSKDGEKLFVSALKEGVYYINTKNKTDLKHLSTYKLDKAKASALSSTLNAKEDTLFISYGRQGMAKIILND